MRKGEKGTMIVYYDTIERPDKNNADEIKKIPFIKTSHVFNRSQLQSFNAETVVEPEQKPMVERIDTVDKFINDTGARIEHKNGQGACYIPALDKIIMPEIDNFQDQADCKAAEAYYSTLFHEVTHWTGAAQRLDRKLSTSFGTEKYAQEELVAELGASFMGAEFGIEKAPVENHAAYIKGWLKKLQDDKHMIFKAASEASKATSFLHRLQEERSRVSGGAIGM